jgi:hypothetical protein
MKSALFVRLLAKSPARLIIFTCTCVGFPSGIALGQDLCASGPQASKVACTLPAAVIQAGNNAPFPVPLGPGGPTGNAQLVMPLTSSLPLPSPASGYTYVYDRASGAFVRSSESFGPILAERADPIGRNRISFGATYQRYDFSRVDGQDLNNLQLGTTNFDLNLSLNQVAAFMDYGLSDRVDASIAIPFSVVQYEVNVRSSIVAPGGQVVSFGSFEQRHASGIGDINLQLKGLLKRWEHSSLAFATTFRLPTGDAFNALGAGAPGIKPFLIFSANYNRINPHINIGYQWNGKSILAGNIGLSVKREIPGQIPYVVGVDFAANKKLTLNLDVLGQEVIHGDRILKPTAVQLPDGSIGSSIGFGRSSYNMTNGSAGLKFNPGGKLLVIFDVLFRLNSSGLRSTASPLIGLSYTL